MNESAPQGVTIHLGRHPETGEVIRVDAPAAPLAAPLVAVPQGPSDGGPEEFRRQEPFRRIVTDFLRAEHGSVEADNVGKSEFMYLTRLAEYAALAAPSPAPLQGQSAALPNDEAHIQHVEYWADAYTNPSNDDSHFCGHPVAGMLLTEYAALLRRASLPLPAPAGSGNELAAHAIEELRQLGYTVRDGRLVPPDNLGELAQVAGWKAPQ